MKRVLCVLLAALMCIAVFSGCRKPEPLRVLVDADETDWEVNSSKRMMEEFLKSVEAMGGPSNVELEVLPESGDAREAAIDRIREQITHVYFRGDVMDVFDEMYSQCWRAYNKGKDIVPVISEYYGMLKQMIAE